jgi:PAS domain S-box-containing protein
MARPAGNAARPASGWTKSVAATAGGVALSFAAFAWASVDQERRLAEEFERLAGGAARALDQEVEWQSAIAQSLRALWQSSDSVDAAEFQSFAGVLLEEFPAARSIQWIEAIPSGEDGLRSQPARDGSEVVAPAARRWRVLYESPPRPDAEAGRERSIDPQRQALLARALARDRCTRASLDAGSSPSFLVVLPVPGRTPRAGAEERPAELEGFALAEVGLEELVALALEDFPMGQVQLGVFGFASAASAAPLAGRGLEAADRGALEDVAPHTVAALDELDWRVVCAPTAAWRSSHRGALPWVALAAGLVVTGTLARWHRSMSARNRSLSRANAELYTEVAERHAVEKELRETQRALATLVANLPGAAYRCANDAAWTIEFVSDGCIPLTGYTPAEFLADRVSFGRDLIHPADRDYVWNAVQQALERRRPFQLVYRIRTLSGEEKWVWEQGRGVHSRAGELLALEGFITDVTERKRAEEALRREKLFVDATIASLPGNFYVFDEGGRFLRWNKNVEAVTGYGADELARMNPLDFFAEPERARVAAALAEVFERGHTRLEARLSTKGGGAVPFHFTGVRFSYEGENYLVGMGVDLSDRERARAEAASVREHLVPAQRLEALAVIAGGVAGDLENLLSVARGSALRAEEALDAGTPAQGLLQQSIGASGSALRLARQLLALTEDAAGDEGAAEPAEAVVQVRELMLASLFPGVTLALDLAQDLPRVELRASELRQLVLNLALNAVEACAARGGRVTISVAAAQIAEADLERVSAGGTPARAFVRLTVRDDGPGMDPATLARLGEAFFTTKLAGRGLGLAAVLEILRGAGGWMAVDSAPGAGSAFEVYLPAAQAPG